MHFKNENHDCLYFTITNGAGVCKFKGFSWVERGAGLTNVTGDYLYLD